MSPGAHTTALCVDHFHNEPAPIQLGGFIDDCISCNIASGLHQKLIPQIMLRKWDFGQLKINMAVFGWDVGIGLIRH